MFKNILIISHEDSWYTEDAFSELVEDLDLDEKARLINATIDQCEERLDCSDCTARISLHERIYWLDYIPHCADCFEGLFSEMPIAEIVRRAELDYIEAID